MCHDHRSKGFCEFLCGSGLRQAFYLCPSGLVHGHYQKAKTFVAGEETNGRLRRPSGCATCKNDVPPITGHAIGDLLEPTACLGLW